MSRRRFELTDYEWSIMTCPDDGVLVSLKNHVLYRLEQLKWPHGRAFPLHPPSVYSKRIRQNENK